MNKGNKGDPQGPEAAEFTEQAAPAADDAVLALSRHKKPPTPRRCRDFIRKQAAEAMPEIVKIFVDEAKKGSVRHFASLTKVGGFDQRPSASEAPKRRRKSLGRQLLDEVEKYEAMQAAELAAANAAKCPIENDPDSGGQEKA